MARIPLFLPRPFDPTHRFETSWLVSPLVLFFIRALISLYAFTVLFFNIGYTCAHPSLGGCTTARNSFSFFTVLTYWGLAFYFLVSAFHTLMYIRRGYPPLNSWPAPLQWLHALYYSTATSFPLIVVIVFWALLAAPGTLSTPYSAWSNISEHVLNSAFAVVEIVLPRTLPSPWVFLPAHLFLVSLYLALAYITYATKGFYTYSFLDPRLQGPLVAAYVFGIAAGLVVLFAVSQGLILLRLWLTEEKFGCRGVFARKDSRRHADHVMDLEGDEERALGTAGGSRDVDKEHELGNVTPAPHAA